MSKKGIMSFELVLLAIKDILRDPRGRHKPVLRSALHWLTIEREATRATQAELDHAHSVAVRLATLEAERYLNGQVTDPDGNPKSPPAHVVSNLTQLLRATGVTAPERNRGRRRNLPASVLEELDKLNGDEQ